MGNQDNLGTNNPGINDGLMPPSLLESASLEDNSPLIELQKSLKKSISFDPVNLLANKDNKSQTSGSSQDFSEQNLAISYNPSVSNIFGSEQSFIQPQTSVASSQQNNQNIDSLTGEPNYQTTTTSYTASNSIPNFAIRSEGTITINGNSDLDGVPTDPTDDALIYAAKGFTINGNSILPVQRDAAGNPLKDASGKLILVDKAVAVSTGYTVANAPNNKYANLVPPQLVDKLSVNVPLYADIKQLELARRIPSGTPTVTFNASQNPLNNANDWSQKFPQPGTASTPTVVRVTGGGLNIPSNITLNNYVIIVEQGDINFNGNNHNFNNVALITNNGNINLSNVQAKELAVFASGLINMNGGAKFIGTTLLANANTNGSIIFNGATSSINPTDNLRVISQGDIIYNGASNTRGSFLSVKNFTYNGNSILYGTIGAKGNIIFNGGATVIQPDAIAPVVTASLLRDTAPGNTTNTDKITSDPAIVARVSDNSPILELRAGFNSTPSANYKTFQPQYNADGSFTINRTQLESIYGTTLPDGIHTLHLQAIDFYGNLSNIYNLTFYLDTKTLTPNNLDLTANNDTGNSNTDNITNKNQPTITGNAEAGAVVKLSNNGQVIGAGVANSNGVWQIVTSTLTDGIYNLTATAEDIAGNVSSSSTPLQIVVDTIAPNAPTLKLATNSDTGISNSDKITKNSTPTLQGNAASGSIVRLYKEGQQIGQTTATSNGTWELQTQTLTDGQHIFTATAEDVAGNKSAVSSQLTITVDTTIAPPSNLNLVVASDSGISNSDRVTQDSTPTISGNAEAFSTVQLFHNGQLLGQTTTDGNGNWQFTTNNLADGIYNITAIASDIAGNVSTNSTPINFTIDTALPQLTLFTPVDTQSLQQTSRLTGTVDGTGSAVVALSYRFDQLPEIAVPLSSNGAFDQAFDLTGIANGQHTLTLVTTDLAGNTKTIQYNVTVAVDNQAPIITATLQRDTALGNTTNSDRITFDPSITGTVNDANSVVSFRAGFENTIVANFINVLPQRQADGSFSFNRTQLEQIYGGTLPDGQHVLTLQAVDSSGNVSGLFAIAFTLDTTTPAPTLELSKTSDSGISNSDLLTNDATPTITGTAEAGAFVQLFSDGQQIGQTTANTDGSWQIVTSDLTDGIHNLSASVTDIAGNTNSSVSSLAINIDTALPQLTLTKPVNQAPLRSGDKLAGSIDGTGSNITSLSYRFNNGAEIAISHNVSGAFEQELDLTGLGNGIHILTITALDAAGNRLTTQYNVTVQLDETAPVITASLANDTAPGGTTNNDFITFDPTIRGNVVDTSRVAQFKAGFDNTPIANFINITTLRQPDGSFTLNRQQLESIYGGTLSEGLHTLHLQAVDEFGNQSNVFDLSFTLDTSVITPTFNLDATSDSGVIGDQQTSQGIVNLVGQTEANATVTLEQTGTVVISDSTGKFIFSNVQLVPGNNSFTVKAIDIAGNENTFNTTIYRFSPPTAINLVGNMVAENSATGTVIGQLSSIDSDTQDSYTYTLVDDALGRFQIVGNSLQVADGTLLDFESNNQHSITVRSTDTNGLSKTEVFSISVTNINEKPSFSSQPTLVVDVNNPYTYNITTTDPDIADQRIITATNLPSWLTLRDNGNGTATLTGTSNEFLNGKYNITLSVQDIGGLTATQTYELSPQVNLIEGANFATTRTLPFTVPNTPSILSFKIDPQFDISDANAINDAFEVALVDVNGNSLVHTIVGGRDAFFNWTEGEPIALGAGASYNSADRTVRLNLVGITPNTNAKLIFRLVNNDRDTTTNVKITDFALLDAPVGTQSPNGSSFSTQTTSQSGSAPNFNLLADVSSSIAIEYHRTTLNADTRLLYADIALHNVGSYSVDAPLIVAVKNISDPSVFVRQPDGFTPDGIPYYNFSNLVGDRKLDRDEVTSNRSLIFYNPQGIQFTYDLAVLAEVNAAPTITTNPNLEIIGGQYYHYDVNATDPNGDSLTYKLLVSPDGMTIDATTGLINWETTTIGNQVVVVEVDDNRGGVTQQQYTLSVIDAPPNRPPVFTSTPIVDAKINTPYTYQLVAQDADRDSLTFSLVNGPQGMTIDPNTGVVNWTPTGTQLGTYNVVFAVTDGRGGVAEQAFQVRTQAQAGNYAPTIISEATTSAYISKTYTYDVDALDADNDVLTYSLVQAPEGMTIDARTGIISWTTPVVGQQDVTVQVQDSRGGVDVQSFTLNTSDVVPGVISGRVYVDNGGPKEQLIYFEDFEDPTKSLSEWSNPKTEITPVGERSFLGRYARDGQGGGKTSLTLNDLPEHDKITLSFKLFVIESWDGNANWLGDVPHTWDLIVRDGPTLLHTNFLNVDFYWYENTFGQHAGQAYPNNYPDTHPDIPSTANNAPRTGASEVNTLGYSFYGDTVYDLTFTFEHSGDNLILDFSGDNPFLSFDNESWGLDDIEIRTISQGKGLANVPVYLDSNNNGQRDGDEVFTRTDNQGNYSFNVAAGNYTVVQELQPTWSLTTPTTGNYQVTVANNQVIKQIDFVNVIGSAINSPPTFLSQPTTTAMAGQKFRYKPIASDPDGDPVSYSLKVGPDGMVIDPTTGLISWVPTANDLGLHDVILSVADGRGEQTLQSFQIKVDPFNSLPVFLSGPGYGLPTEPIAVGQTYSYQPRTQDPDGDTITYSLTAAPSNAHINPQTGLLTWTPTDSQIGQQSFAITINDGRGGKTTQFFDIQVLEAQNAPLNQNPAISSSPRTEIALGQSYFYAVQVADPNGDPLSMSLENAPAGMTIDSSGRIFWQPQASQLGSQHVTLNVSDGRGGIATQSFDINVVSAASYVNNAPIITSAPNLITNLDRAYEYNLAGSDPDGDLLFWSLDNAPVGMVIDSQTGALRWNPTSTQIGEHTVAVRLTDAYGLYVGQEFTLTVTGINAPPAIVSNPVTKAALNQQYTYNVVANDPENDALTFSLGRAPAGMTIDSNGTIRWTPQATQVGQQEVEVLVTDGQGAVTSQIYTIEVGTNAINHAPSITSTPVYIANTGSAYNYQVVATDPDAGDRLTYQLLSVPAGVTGITIDANTGLLTWQNPVAGNYRIVVGAVDAGGLGAAQGFNLTARANNAPVIRSNPVLTATPGSAYAYDIIAADVDGDRLTYTLDQASLNKGITLDTLGRLRWNPTVSNVGTHRIVLSVSDGITSTPQQYDLVVAADTVAPQVRLIANYDTVDLGETVIFQARATDNIKVAGLQLLVNGNAVVLDANGMARYTTTEPGTIFAQAIATDTAGNIGQATFDVAVIDTSDVNAPEVSLNLGAIAGSLVTAPIDIRGSISDDGQLDYYRLLVAPVAGGEFREIAFVDNPNAIANGVLGKFDPSLLQNDSYILRLEVADNGGNISYSEQVVDVAGELKLGNFRLSFTDLTVPVTGIPITLTRTYDTLTSGITDDFGYGWRMEFRDTDLRTSLRPPSEEEQLLGYQSAFKDGTRVYITLPGGKREAFTFKPTVDPIFGLASSIGGESATVYKPGFVGDKGVTSTLTVKSARILRKDGTDEYVGLNGGINYNPADVNFGNVYVLTTKEGIVYEIDAATGDLLTVTDTNGNKLTYTDDGIYSSAGKQVTFERDAQGRIASVKDPMGELIRYTYDAKGDLISVTDRENNTTRMEYNQERSHYLDKIIDPLNRTGAKANYDEATGRLKEIVDVNGQKVEMSYDPNNSKQVIKDTRGYSTTYIYDQRGNVLQEIDALGGITTRTYDDENNLLTKVDPDGVSTTYTYDNKGNISSIADQDGNVTRITYNKYGETLNIISPRGLTVSSTYDGNGNLLSRTNTDGQTVTFSYDNFGRLIKQTAADGEISTYTYDAFGNATSFTDSRGNQAIATYDLNGKVKTMSMVFPKENQTLNTSYTYDNEGRTTSITDPQGNVTTTEYDAKGNIIATTDIKGNRTQYFYDEKGQQVKVILPDNTPNNPDDNPVVLTEYDAVGMVISQTSATGLKTRYVYDQLGRLAETILPDLTPENSNDNPIEKIEYTAAGRIKADVDIFGTRTEYTYDNLGRVSKQTDFFGNSAGNNITYTYNTDGQVTSITDAKNRTTLIGIDDKGRPSVTTYFDGTTSQVTYDNLGRTKSETNQLGQTTNYEYDAFGKVAAIINPLNQKTQFTYNSRGSLVKVTDALNHETKYEYDQFNRQIAVINANGDRTETTYDQYGQVAAVKDGNQHITQYFYNNLGALTAVKLANQATTNYIYDNLGRLTQFEDANHNKTTYEYDAFNRQVATNLPLGQRATTTYNNLGEVANTKDFNGDVITYSYDQYGRLASKLFSDTRVATVSYTYDPVTSQLKTVTDVRGVTTYSFDSYDRVNLISNPDGQTVGYTYDVLGNLKTLTTSGSTVNYSYDQLNRLNTVISGKQLAKYDYDAVGNLISTTLGDGTIETRQYDANNWLNKIETRDTSGTVLSSYAYTLDGLGHRTQVVENTGRTVNYTYDEVDQLKLESINDPILGNRTISYDYDLVGNRLKRNDSDPSSGLTTYIYDKNNRLISQTSGTKVTQYTYDNNGSMLTSDDGTNSVVYEWINDGENRLVGVKTTNANGSSQTKYIYDADGNRVTSITDGVRKNYLVDPRSYSKVLQEYDANGQILTKYFYGLGLIKSESGSDEKFYHSDGLGSTRLLTDGTGQVTDRYVYDAFGRLIANAGGSDNAYQFAGEQRDSTGLDYLRARYYDSDLGRFISKDAFAGHLASPISQNAYVYANANPVNITDPSGYESLEEASVASAIAGIFSSFSYASVVNIGRGIIGGALFGLAYGLIKQDAELIEGRRSEVAWNEVLNSTYTGAAFGGVFVNFPLAGAAFAAAGVASAIDEARKGHLLSAAVDLTFALGPLASKEGSEPILKQIEGILSQKNVKVSINQNTSDSVDISFSGDGISNFEVLYHGTSSSRAKNIVEGGFKKSPTYLAEEQNTAEYFAFESLSKYALEVKRQNRYTLETAPKSLTIIKFQIPKELATELKIDQANRSLIGEEKGLPTPIIEGGSGHERILYNIDGFNKALKSGQITTSRYRRKL
ncbi:Ig-like domain-containing protein [Aulosira sp. FACHB-615]|uniref:Ig-like domain-containing protein n=1 Tax=Aulosira sp. FACHB-615 TaxID=2692777 RepID=UPI00168A2AAC|nr:Ig-like domain-containing protein [Aulosira sp. FACHB-615]MBD2491385.1 putative Ig domain-containing protein [Aulosira sp. FACHB-615]